MKIIDGVTYHSYDNKTIVIDTLNSGKIYLLEGTSNLIWNLLIEEKKALQNALQEYIHMFPNVDDSTLIKDFNNFVAMLKTNNIIKD